MSVIDYLNEIGKQFKVSPKATERLMQPGLRDGYKLDDFKMVIDMNANIWLNDAYWHQYLPPSTQFKPAL